MSTRRPADPVADLVAFLDASPSPYHVVAESARRLEAAGFTRLDPTTAWPATPLGFVARGGALVAWSAPPGAPDRPLAVIGAHTDSPNLRLKPRPDHRSAGVAQLGIEPYGGLLANSWLDRDLGLSGRVVIDEGTRTRTELFRDDRPLLRVPQLAIHLDRGIDEHGLRLDRSRHLTPIWGIDDAPPFGEWLARELGVTPEAVLAWDLMAHDVVGAARTGPEGELLASARLDNLCSCYGALTALVTTAGTEPDAAAPVAMVVLFDHEEVGSTSATGAAGSFLRQTIERVVTSRGGGTEEAARALAAGRVLSADMAHATHPNYPDRHDPDHPVRLGGGPVVKTNVNQRYATSAPGAAEFRRRCGSVGVPVQVYAHRNDLPCGSTIGPLTAAAIGADTVDVGMAQLAMHSIREVMATADVALMVAAFEAWFT